MRKLTSKRVSKFLGLNLDEWTIERDPGIVDQAIDSTQEIQRRLRETGARSSIGEIGLDAGCPPSHGLDRKRCRFRRFRRVAVVEHNIRALARKLERDFTPDPRTGAGYQRPLCLLASRFRSFLPRRHPELHQSRW